MCFICCTHIRNRSRPLPPAGKSKLPTRGQDHATGVEKTPTLCHQARHSGVSSFCNTWIIVHLHAVCQYLTNYFKCSIYTVNAFCSHLHMTVMSYAFPLLFCTHFFQVVLPETYQECLALVGRSGGAERAAIARELHLPPHLQESPDLRRLLRNTYRKYNASIMPDI